MLQQILLELQSRFQTGLIAGSHILLSDERLPMLLKKVETLAQKSPVFQKLYTLCLAIFNDQDHLENNIMEAMSFLDALIMTQAQWKYEEDIYDITILTEKPYTNIKYSQLKPLIQALSQPGSGRYEIILSTWNKYPDLFQDYRVLPYVIAGLGDSYSEIANLCVDILKSCGKKVVPLLKENFNPSGKKEMLRRISLIVELAGKDENQFYLDMYPLSQTDIQKQIIIGLSYNSTNRDFLMNIADVERGKLKEYALYALSHIQDDEVDKYLLKKIKKSQKTLFYTLYSNNEDIKQIICEDIQQQLSKIMKYQQIETDKEAVEIIKKLSLLAYKTGPQIIDIVAWIFDHDDKLCMVKDSQQHLFVQLDNYSNVTPLSYTELENNRYTITEYVAEVILNTYLVYQNEESETLIKTLYERYPQFMASAYARMLLIKDYKHAYETLTTLIDCQKPRDFYSRIFQYVEYDQETKQYVYRSKLISYPLKTEVITIVLGDELDHRWIDLLLGKQQITKGLFKKEEMIVYGNEIPLCSCIMVHLASKDNLELKDTLIAYFEQHKSTACHLYIEKLYQLPLRDDLLAYFKKQNTFLSSNRLSYHQMVSMCETFCNKNDSLYVLKEILTYLKKKTKSDYAWQFYEIENAINRYQESEEII